MQSEYVLEILGDPVPWARPAINRQSGGRFIPARQSTQAGLIGEAWSRKGYPRFDRETPIVLSVQFYVSRPATHYGTGRNAGSLKDWAVHLRPLGRPDCSNLLKLAEDALTHYAWADDDQVVGFADCAKFYVGSRDESPRTVITVRPLAAIDNAATDALQPQLVAA